MRMGSTLSLLVANCSKAAKGSSKVTVFGAGAVAELRLMPSSMSYMQSLVDVMRQLGGDLRATAAIRG